MMLQCSILLLFIVTIHGSVFQVPSPFLTLSSNNMTEGQSITLTCVVYPGSTQLPPLTWFWKCGNDNLTGNATTGLHNTALKIKADRKYNGETCFCKVRPSSANDSYSKMSNHVTINVKYAPKTIPFLNTTSTAVVAGEEITLQCTLDSMGNPQIRWTWKCGRYTVYNRRIVNMNATTKLILEADSNLNEKICHCVARSYQLNYEAASNSVSLTVYYFPDGYPEIDRSVFFVNKNTPVTLRCSLNSLGNPPVVWYWYCDNKPILRGIKNTNFGSSLTMIAQLSDHNTACHCRAKSESQWGSYDKNSSKALITIRRVVIVFHHRRIVDMGTRLSTEKRENKNDTGGGQDNLNYSTLREESSHSKE
ncbi:synaptogenesis protein syg-2-like isoform X2 [Ostrea edulis]|uniref:synaptogenesis protein syg-2-like isoform X2 n=1 Tax=Ostrea edulis TaxID=37623 RepID=UPI002095B175|nr:synaptogenesis protein syg-2-like isoform X2 [Ostrea edulis]